MKAYYAVLHKPKKEWGVAYVLGDYPISMLPNEGEVSKWDTPAFEAREGELTDYMANNRALRMCSKKLRDIVNLMTSERDCIQWLKVSVVFESSPVDYFVMHFTKVHDVIDKTHSIMVGDDFVVKPVLSALAVNDHLIATFRGAETSALLVRSDLKQLMQKEHCTGIQFSRRAVSNT